MIAVSVSRMSVSLFKWFAFLGIFVVSSCLGDSLREWKPEGRDIDIIKVSGLSPYISENPRDIIRHRCKMLTRGNHDVAAFARRISTINCHTLGH